MVICRMCAIVNAGPSNSACTTYSAGAINRNENSIGSVMPVRNEVSAADSSSPPTRLRFSGRALWYIAGQAPTAEHHGDKAAGHETCRADVELLRIRVGQLGEENALCAFHQLSVDHFAAAERGGPERQIEDVMQAERPEHAQYEAVDKGAEIAAGVHHPAHAEDQPLERRPHHRHQGADRHRRQRADDRYKARAAEKPGNGGSAILL